MVSQATGDKETQRAAVIAAEHSLTGSFLLLVLRTQVTCPISSLLVHPAQVRTTRTQRTEHRLSLLLRLPLVVDSLLLLSRLFSPL